MAAITHNSKLNDLLVELGRSLLQYAAESWPWSGAAHTPARAEFIELAAEQRADVGRLAEFLDRRGWMIDFGAYPSDYTDLHFLALKYFLPRVVQDQAAIVAELDEAVHTCVDDPAAVAVLQPILATERKILASLETMTAPAAATTSAAPAGV